MVGNDSDDEETNDLFAELLNDDKNEKQKKIEEKKEKAQPINHVSKEVDDIGNMLANLWFIYFIDPDIHTNYSSDKNSKLLINQNLSSIL